MEDQVNYSNYLKMTESNAMQSQTLCLHSDPLRDNQMVSTDREKCCQSVYRELIFVIFLHKLLARLLMENANSFENSFTTLPRLPANQMEHPI